MFLISSPQVDSLIDTSGERQRSKHALKEGQSLCTNGARWKFRRLSGAQVAIEGIAHRLATS